MASEGAGTGRDLVRSFESLSEEFCTEIAALHTEPEIRLAQSRYLGKKGRATELMKLLGRIPPADRPLVGAAANRARESIEQLVEARLGSLANANLAAQLSRRVDVTLPGRGRRAGAIHPLTRVRLEIEEIFHGMGFEVRT